jgi:hypothetical protein
MSSEEASKVLQVNLGADWETIEKPRRKIVQKSHPDKVRTLPPERRRALIEHAPGTMRLSRFCSACEFKIMPAPTSCTKQLSLYKSGYYIA